MSWHAIGEKSMRIFPKRDAFLASFIFLLSTNISVFAVAQSAIRVMLDEYQEKVAIVVRIASQMTNGDLHKTIVDPKQKGGFEYREIQKWRV